MNRRIIAVICIILCITFVFVGCARKKYYTDQAGNRHIAYTNENGETVTDAGGNVIVISTNAAGKEVTDKFGDPVTMAAEVTGIHVEKGGKFIRTAAYELSVPDGWVLYSEIEDYAQLKYGSEDSDVACEIQFSKNSYEDEVKLMKSIHKNFVEGVEEVSVNTEEETSLRDGEIKPVTKLSFIGSNTVDGTKSTIGYTIYVFSKGTYTFRITCGVRGDNDLNSIDFDKVLDAISYK